MCSTVYYVFYVVSKNLETYFKLIFPVGFDTDPPLDRDHPLRLAVRSEEVTRIPFPITVIIK